MFAYTTCPPDPAVVGDRWRDDVARAARRRAPLGARVAAPPAPRRLLAPRLRVRGLLGRRVPGARLQRLGRRLLQRGVPAAEPPRRAAQGADRPVVAQVPAPGRAGPRHRLPAGGRALVGPLAEGRRQRRDGRAHAADLDAGERAAVHRRTRSVPAAGSASRPGPRRTSQRCRPPAARPPDSATRTTRSPRADRGQTVQSPLSVGQFAGKWGSYNAPPDLPYDQREEDGGSLVFETDAADRARARSSARPSSSSTCAADQPVAMVAVRLSDVAPDGTRHPGHLRRCSTSPTATATDDAASPWSRAAATGSRVPLNGVAQAFPPGHRIRLSLSTSYWPLAWPPPEPVLLTVYEERSTLTLPVRPTTEPEDTRRGPSASPKARAPLAAAQLCEPEQRWTVVRGPGRLRVGAGDRQGPRRRCAYEDIGLDVGLPGLRAVQLGRRRLRLRARRVGLDDALRPRRLGRTGRDAHGADAPTTTDFQVDATLDGYEGDRRVFSRTWNERVPRDHVRPPAGRGAAPQRRGPHPGLRSAPGGGASRAFVRLCRAGVPPHGRFVAAVRTVRDSAESRRPGGRAE